ncbi:succinyl-diaminopimelate desuccinylase [Humitalea sp. 24SJ18S-53]|uniref:succinyl-diaminopimelate desuccinylase n=1 Tax=Humitalea sp. 24SJ18S-53 TaxID=3422307 RepID=UPI003D66C738
MGRDPLPLAQALIRCPSVTPADAGALDVVAAALRPLGFSVHRLGFGTTPNLFARRGDSGPHLCFAGHTDVVPPGAGPWTTDPFGAEVRDGVLFGRGATDMKGGVAAFIAAIPETCPGSLSLLITGDEEGPATDGTVKVLGWMAEHGHIPDMCLVGEPTSKVRLGDTIKVGRRGSLNAAITIHGTQGHAAYPQKADNPIHRMVRVLAALTAEPLDAGSEFFEASSLQVTSVDVGNAATNVIPGSATARLNIRFNDLHSSDSLGARLHAVLAEHAPRHELSLNCSGESFLTQPGPFVEALRRAVRATCATEPALDTGGGTSDARFIARYCPVAELGAVGATMHKADEQTPVAELRDLTRLYAAVIAETLGQAAVG